MQERQIRLLLLAMSRNEEIIKIAALSKYPEKVVEESKKEKIRSLPTVDWELLSEDIKDCVEIESKVVSRTVIQIPACDELKEYLRMNGIKSLIICATRGIAEDEKMPFYDSRVSDVDGVVLMCSSSSFPRGSEKRYREVYSRVFMNCLVFVEARYDALKQDYEKWSEANDDVTEEKVKSYLQQVNAEELSLLKDIENTHFLQGLLLLSRLGGAEKRNDVWKLEYPVYKLNDIKYVMPTSAILAKLEETEKIDVKLADYDFLRMVGLVNVKDVIDKICEYEEIWEKFDKETNLKKEFFEYLKKNITEKMVMSPPNKYGWRGLWDAYKGKEDLNKADFLGEKDGVTTKEWDVNAERPKYLATLTCATTAFKFMHDMNLEFKIEDAMLNDVGKKQAKIPLENQKELAKKYIWRKIFGATDKKYNTKDIIERHMTVSCIKEVWEESGKRFDEDALEKVVLKIAEKIFQ